MCQLLKAKISPKMKIPTNGIATDRLNIGIIPARLKILQAGYRRNIGIINGYITPSKMFSL